MRKLNLTGEKYGRLNILREIEKTHRGLIRWECICDCGKIHNVNTCDLRSGNTKSCGCYDREKFLERFTTHGKARTPEHIVWMSMKARCLNKKSTGYYQYGARGITICKRWLNFENFIHDMGLKPSPQHTIERMNNNGNYEPINCKWATKTEQARNQRRRKDNISGVSGVTWYRSSSKWVVKIGANRKLIHIGYFDNLQDAANARKEAEREYWHV